MRTMRGICIALLAAAAAWAAPAVAAAGNFTLVNGTGSPMSAVAIRRAGTDDWRPLAVAPAPGQAAAVQFSNPDCAFDIRASVGGATAIWSGVNLCETKRITLSRAANGVVWVDYD